MTVTAATGANSANAKAKYNIFFILVSLLEALTVYEERDASASGFGCADAKIIVACALPF